jgi:hypothetical protein
MSNGVNFTKDYQKDPYNILKNSLKKTALEKKLILKKMWNSKTLKIQRIFKNYFKISNLQKSFTTYKWVIMYMMYFFIKNLDYSKTK